RGARPTLLDIGSRDLALAQSPVIGSVVNIENVFAMQISAWIFDMPIYAAEGDLSGRANRDVEPMCTPHARGRREAFYLFANPNKLRREVICQTRKILTN